MIEPPLSPTALLIEPTMLAALQRLHRLMRGGAGLVVSALLVTHRRLEALDIRHVYIRPRTSHLNGKVERSHRIDDQGGLPAPRQRRHHRGHSAVQQEIAGVGGILQLLPAARRARRPDTVRAPQGQAESGNVTGVLGTYTSGVTLG